MKIRTGSIHRKLLAVGIACALGLPLAVSAHAANASNNANSAAPNAADNGSSARTQSLERRVDQLQRELEQLQQEIQAQHAAQRQRAATPPPAPTPAPTPAFSSAPGVHVAFHGFISATGFAQSRNMAIHNGQGVEWPAAGAANSHDVSGFDIRNTRFWFDVTGATLPSGWAVAGHLEGDLWGGNTGDSSWSSSMPVPRLRQAWIKLVSPSKRTSYTIGQQFNLITLGAMFPVSNTHITFPYGFGLGAAGWRFPGVVWNQTLNHPAAGGTKLTLSGGIFSGTYKGPVDNKHNNNYLTAGNFNFHPQYEMRLGMQNGDLLVYVAGHYSKLELNGSNSAKVVAGDENFTEWVAEGGVRWTPGRFRLRFTAHTGNAMANMIASMLQFGDIKDNAANFQAGWAFTKKLTYYMGFAYDNVNTGDVETWVGPSGLIRGKQASANLVWNDGPFGLGLDYLWGEVETVNHTKTTGSQLAASAVYHF